MTCNVGYSPNSQAASGTGIKINEFYGDSITVESIERGKWNSYGTPIPNDFPKGYIW